MPNAKFLEEYQLYRKFDFPIKRDTKLLPISLNEFPKVNLNMYCPNCNNIRTFKFNYKYIHKKEKNLFIKNIDNHFQIKFDFSKTQRPSFPVLEENDIVNLNYICASCEDYYRFFAIKMGKGLKTIEKVGQFPAWDISIEKNLKKILKGYSEYYKKGKTCESQSYGIGAFAYYRRIIEDIIGELLELIPDLMNGEELEKYRVALEEVRKTNNTTNKIALVKDLLPPILKPEQFNPLKTIHDVLSTGIHGKTDEQCLEDAESIRTSLIFLVDAILSRKKGQQEYTESMKKILEKRRKKINKNEN
ncbi:MAG: hypothetical protein CEE43_02190 [Promethearchaeota archaeon Loki_b32]|nr:MAG: hypothetical protein CEE43_02190 [Candidatus Lokiarchaeota archaeon Loki_b32]